MGSFYSSLKNNQSQIELPNQSNIINESIIPNIDTIYTYNNDSRIKPLQLNINCSFVKSYTACNSFYWLYSNFNVNNDNKFSWAFYSNPYSNFIEATFNKSKYFENDNLIFNFNQMIVIFKQTNVIKHIIRIDHDDLKMLEQKYYDYIWSFIPLHKNLYSYSINKSLYLYPPFIQELLKVNKIVNYYNNIINITNCFDMFQINSKTLKKITVSDADSINLSTNRLFDNVVVSFNI